MKGLYADIKNQREAYNDSLGFDCCANFSFNMCDLNMIPLGPSRLTTYSLYLQGI
jgi:hypothetical protein